MEVPAVEYKELSGKKSGRTSADILERVKGARLIQAERFQRMKIHKNADMKKTTVSGLDS
jgi:predicted ATPase with chaperone activity